MLPMIAQFLSLVSMLVIIDAVLSWMMPPDQPPRSVTARLLAPLYAPIHAILDPQKTGGLDLSPLILIVVLHVVRSMLLGAAA